MRCIRCNIILNNDNWLICRRNRNYHICKFCINNDNKIRYSKNKNKYLITYKNKRMQIKSEVILLYGGKCQLCDENNFNKLSLDHIDGNGRKHRASVLKIDSGSAFLKWVLKNKPDNLRLLCYNCNCQHDMLSNNKRVNLKKDIYDRYGGQCINCGCHDYKFLTIDHIDNNGAKHRKEIGSDIYNWLKKNNYPKENFQILCFNCNYLKYFNNTINIV